MNLVAECTTMSAPCSSGRNRKGVAKVLSTMRGMPWAWAISARASMSAISQFGLPRLSTYRALVFSRMALEKLFTSPGVHEGGFNPAFRERVGKQVVRASVHGGRGNDVVPGAGDVLDGVGDGGGPGGYGQRGGSAFQRGDAFFKNVRRGVHQAVVNIARLRQGKTSGGLRGAP